MEEKAVNNNPENIKLIELKDYKFLDSKGFDAKIDEDTATVLVKISFPNDDKSPIHLELFKQYTLDDSFQLNVNKDVCSILNFHALNHFKNKRIIILKKCTPVAPDMKR